MKYMTNDKRRYKQVRPVRRTAEILKQKTKNKETVEILKQKTKNKENVKTSKILNNKENVSIILTVYEAQTYLESYLDSISNQTYFQNFNNYEILLRIDGCENTLKKAKEIHHNYKNLKIFMIDNNENTHITHNTLISISKYNNILHLNNKILLPFMVEYAIEYFNYDIVDGLSNIEQNKGIELYKRKGINKHKGYEPLLCVTDNVFWSYYDSKDKISEFLIKISDGVLIPDGYIELLFEIMIKNPKIKCLITKELSCIDSKNLKKSNTPHIGIYRKGVFDINNTYSNKRVFDFTMYKRKKINDSWHCSKILNSLFLEFDKTNK